MEHTPRGLAPSTRILLALAAAVVALAGLHAARGVFGPIALGAVIVIIVLPLRAPLVARGWPSWVANTAVIVAAYVILAILLAMLVYAGVQFGHLVSSYVDELRQTAQDITDRLTDLGLASSTADDAARWLDPSKLISIGTKISGTAVSVAGAFFFVLAYVIFMAADAARYSHARGVFGATRGAVIDRAEAFNDGVRRYFVVNATFGAIVAIVDGFALWLLGVPAPAVWAILAFVTNFIPNIGFVLGLVPPAVLALVVGGWPLALAVVAVYCVVNVVLQVLVQPKFVADTVNLSLTLSFASVVFWTFVIGPLGAILAIPLTLLVRTLVLEPDPGAGWLRWLSGDPAARDPGPGAVVERDPEPAPAEGAPPA
ncbi:AI-2E family transporter [Luteimicrobium sp. DT211]|uniref:AI-2E family transporter n=1 Tax=Luteimicrobium sp. DT211 TaxID=3393412 RepID=UPI003CF75C2B